MSVLRELYFCLVFLFGAVVPLAPYLFGIGEQVFAYETAKGKSVDLPVSVSIYAGFLLISIATLVLRLVSKQTEESANAV
ncbi:MAG: hypothetical protein H7145_04020 [Akkermansiaceae bacterium]|nr:hypothetical protein [Armatimonadota bacterium]